jgi:hypothetical protein
LISIRLSQTCINKIFLGSSEDKLSNQALGHDAQLSTERTTEQMNTQSHICIGTIGSISDCGSEGIGIDPHSGQKQSEAIIFSVHLNRQGCSGGSELLCP